MKGILDGSTTKYLEFERSHQLSLSDLKAGFEKKFGVGSLALRYKLHDKIQPLYQDHHAKDMQKESERTSKEILKVCLTRL